MKIVVRLSVLLLLLTTNSIAQKTAPGAKEGDVVVKGKIGEVNLPCQLWIYIGDEKWDTVPVKNGVFEYRKRTLLPAYGAIMVKYKPYYAGQKGAGGFFSNMSLMSVFYEPGTMTVVSPVDTLRTATPVEGSVLQTRFRTYWNKEGDIVREQKQLAIAFSNSSVEQLQSEVYQKAYEVKNNAFLLRFDSLITAELKMYPNSYHSTQAFYGYKRQRKPDSATVLKVVEHFGDLYRDKIRAAELEELGKKTAPPPPVITVGTMAPDFEQRNVDGKLLRLSSLRGKYVLIDFWASWCVPCRKVNPDLVKLYQQFKGTSFEILGVSLDSDSTKWKQAITADNLTWLHTSDLKSWKNEVAQQYGIGAIPQNFLVDPSGKVIAKNLNITKLSEELSKLPVKVQK